MTKKKTTSRHGEAAIHLWWPLLCFARGLLMAVPMVAVMMMLYRLGMGNTMATLLTSLLLLPLAARPLTMVPIRALGAGRGWMVGALAVYAVAMYLAADSLASPPDSLALWLWLVVMALAAAVFDAVAADWQNEVLCRPHFTALRSMVPAMLLAVLLGMGLMMMLAGNMEVMTRKVEESWAMALRLGAALVLATMLLLWAMARYAPPRGARIPISRAWTRFRAESAGWWGGGKRWLFLLMTVLVSLHEFFLWRGSLLFLIDRGSIGGLMLSPQEVGFALCTMGVAMAMAGYVVGMGRIRRDGLRRWWWPMALAATLPDALYVYLAYAMPEGLWLITLALSVELWCCGFGLAGFLYYIMYSDGEECSATHVDACWLTGMLSMLLAGVLTGAIQDYFGYRRFFIVVMVMAVVSLAIVGWVAARCQESRGRKF